jgi:NitT/TauT family transport system permease protein
MSLQRIIIGWALGVVVGAPLGILMARIPLVGSLLDPYIQFFRFVPPIAFVTLAIVWFGIGEASKVVLIFYTSVFIVVINTIAGVLSIEESKLRAASSLGASKRQILISVVLPASVPHIVTGARLAMGNSFLTIVSAEMVAAQTGLGSLIWTSRNFGRIDWILVGIITLGFIGFLCDLVIKILSRRLLAKYNVKV